MLPRFIIYSVVSVEIAVLPFAAKGEYKMPMLKWAGKEKVVNHHNDVPFRVLERKWGWGKCCQCENVASTNANFQLGNGNIGIGNTSTFSHSHNENMIIHGDNLAALKALLPQYEGRVKCIYIDPPYNTGNEGWVYNDNVNDPQIKKWLGEVVGKEGEDFSRHDKWLCMMYPRLRLLQKLLADDGAIFISIDDNELYNLKLICDEIFGTVNFVAKITWQNNYSPRNDAKGIPYISDNILVYGKSQGWQPHRLPRTEEMDNRFSSPDGDPTPWTSAPAHAPSAKTHKSMIYAIQHPVTGQYIYPPPNRCWCREQKVMLELMNEWSHYELKMLDDKERRMAVCDATDADGFPEIPAIVLVDDLETSKRNALNRFSEGKWPELYFTKGGSGGMRIKKHLQNMQGKVAASIWFADEVGTSTEATAEIKALFEGRVPFDTAKPSRLIERILRIATDKDSIVLDSFAGSGTTAHAVLKMNKEDGGNRKFILIEMMDYADTVTAERVKRVISGYGEGDKAVEGTGGGFGYYELGDPLMIGENLNEDLPLEKIREYVWYMETRGAGNVTNMEMLPIANANSQSDNGNIGIGNIGNLGNTKNDPYLLGVVGGAAYYFCYEKGSTVKLNRALLRKLKTKAERYVIYADICLLDDTELEKYNITFKKIPRDIARL